MNKTSMKKSTILIWAFASIALAAGLWMAIVAPFWNTDPSLYTAMPAHQVVATDFRHAAQNVSNEGDPYRTVWVGPKGDVQELQPDTRGQAIVLFGMVVVLLEVLLAALVVAIHMFVNPLPGSAYASGDHRSSLQLIGPHLFYLPRN